MSQNIVLKNKIEDPSEVLVPKTFLKKHKRTSSMITDFLPREEVDLFFSGSFDLMKKVENDKSEQYIFNDYINENLLTQNQKGDKVIIIDSIDSEISSQPMSNLNSFYMLRNRLKASSFKQSNLFKTIKDLSAKKKKENEFIKEYQKPNQMHSISEKSEVPSSIINSINRCSNRDNIESLTPKTSKSGLLKDEKNNCEMIENEQICEKQLEILYKDKFIDKSIKFNIFKQNGVRKQDFDVINCQPASPQIKSTKVYSKVNFEMFKMQKTENSMKKSHEKNPFLMKKQKINEKEEGGLNFTSQIVNTNKKNISFEKNCKDKISAFSKLKLKIENTTKKKGFFLELPRNLCLNSPANDQKRTQSKKNSKLETKNSVFQKSSKFDSKNGKKTFDKTTLLIKTKSDDRPDIIQNLFKFRPDSRRCLKKIEYKKEPLFNIYSKPHTLNHFPSIFEKKPRFLPSKFQIDSFRLKPKPKIATDIQLKYSFLKQVDTRKHINMNHLESDKISNLSIEEFLKQKRFSNAFTNQKEYKNRLPSGFKIESQFLLHTESGESARMEFKNFSKGVKLKKNIRLNQQNDIKTKNSNIYIPEYKPSSEVSIEQNFLKNPQNDYFKTTENLVRLNSFKEENLIHKNQKDILNLFRKSKSVGSLDHENCPNLLACQENISHFVEKTLIDDTMQNKVNVNKFTRNENVFDDFGQKIRKLEKSLLKTRKEHGIHERRIRLMSDNLLKIYQEWSEIKENDTKKTSVNFKY